MCRMDDKTGQNNTNLTGRQQRVINALLFSTSITHASKVSGVSRQRIHLWLTQDTFKSELQKARDNVRKDSIEHLKVLFSHAVDILDELLLNVLIDAKVRVRVAEIILNYNLNVIELESINERLCKLENRTNETNS